MNCDAEFGLVMVVLVVSLTANFFVLIRAFLKRVMSAIDAVEEVERGSN